MKQIYFSQRVYSPEGFKPLYIHCEEGKITQVTEDKPAAGFVDFEEATILPGVVDPHVHINEPGRTAWEGFYTATRAAAAGGVTTLVDMPLNSDPVTTSLDAFEQKLQAAQGQLWVDCGFWGGVVPENASELQVMIDKGIWGFKAFLVHSGIDDFPQSTAEDLRKAMPILQKGGVPLLVHAELEGECVPHLPEQAQSYQAFLASRPKSWEDEAIRLMIQLCEETNCATHIVHLSSANALEDIARAKAKGLPFTVETCPHYLYFASEHIPDGQTQYKCMPPIREQKNQEQLWAALRSQMIDFVVTDHSPCTPGLKLMDEGDFLHAWGGIASLQFGLSSVWTRAQARGFSLEELVVLMCEKPAQFVGLGQTKGQLKPGYDADFVVFEPEKRYTLTKDMIHFKHPVSPYLEQELTGQVVATFLRGNPVFVKGTHGDAPQGKPLMRNP